MVLPKVSWYVGCSPRDPRKLIPELNLLLKYEGNEWTRKTQEAFAKELPKLKSFEGEGYGKELAFSTRDRVAKLKTYGFVYLDSKNILRITDAGRAIVESKVPEELFLKQMLKWQYPSFQHKGEEYPEKAFRVRPYILIMKLVSLLGNISKRELAIFAFLTTDEKNVKFVAREIQRFRKVRANLKGVKRKKYEYDYQYSLFKKAYSRFILAGKTHIRESSKRHAEEREFVETKMRNAGDMSDALIRHLRFTPFFSIRGNTVVFSENMLDLVESFVSSPIVINKDYADVEKFYSYFGNPAIPKTPLDNKDILVKKALSIYEEIDNWKSTAKAKEEFVLPRPDDFLSKDLFALKNTLFELIDTRKRYLESRLQEKLMRAEGVDEIIATFGSILSREVIDPPTYFEWNTWRALLHLDDEEKIRPNFSLDADLQPINSAGGKKGDIEAHYRKFNLLVEVTLSSGERQANTEIEPVWRHVGNFQGSNEGKKTFGVFVAPKIVDDTVRHFFIYATNEVFDGKKVTILPLPLGVFIEVLLLSKTQKVTSDDIFNLLSALEAEAISGRHKDGLSWYKQFPKVLEDWKMRLTKQSLDET